MSFLRISKVYVSILLILVVLWRVGIGYIIHEVRKKNNIPTKYTMLLGYLSYIGTFTFIGVALVILYFKAKAKGMI